MYRGEVSPLQQLTLISVYLKFFKMENLERLAIMQVISCLRCSYKSFTVDLALFAQLLSFLPHNFVYTAQVCSSHSHMFLSIVLNEFTTLGSYINHMDSFTAQNCLTKNKLNFLYHTGVYNCMVHLCNTCFTTALEHIFTCIIE